MGDPYYENRIADLESKYELLRWIAEGQVAKLQAEVADKETLIRSAQTGWDIESDKVAKLQAVVDAAKPLLVLQLTDGIERYEAEQALEQAIKEVESECN